MSCPTKLCFEEHGLDGGDLSHFQGPRCWLDEAQMATIGDPGLSSVYESGQHNSFVDNEVRVFL